MINNSPNVEDPDLRVCTNLFGEFESLGAYPVYFTNWKKSAKKQIKKLIDFWNADILSKFGQAVNSIAIQ